MLRKARVTVREDEDGVGRAIDGRRRLHGFGHASKSSSDARLKQEVGGIGDASTQRGACGHRECMSMIQIRDAPEGLHQKLEARAAIAGKSPGADRLLGGAGRAMTQAESDLQPAGGLALEEASGAGRPRQAAPSTISFAAGEDLADGAAQRPPFEQTVIDPTVVLARTNDRGRLGIEQDADQRRSRPQSSPCAERDRRVLPGWSRSARQSGSGPFAAWPPRRRTGAAFASRCPARRSGCA